MRRWFIAALAGALVLAFAPAVAAEEHEGGGTYLALGDSVAAGTQQPVPFTEGYTGLLFDKLADRYGFDDFVNLACPGDDTVEMRFGIGGGSEFGSLCYGPFAVLPPGGTSQLDAAVAYLGANPGEVGLITIAIGANDVLACDPFELPPEELPGCIAAQLGQIGANLPVIIGTLQGVAPGVPIVAMNYYNPNLAFWITGPAGQALADQSLALTEVFNGTLQTVYDAFGVPVVDVASTFKTFQTNGNPPKNVKEVCKLTLMCTKSGGEYVLVDWNPEEEGTQADIHPSDKGYQKISTAHEKLIKTLDLLDD